MKLNILLTGSSGFIGTNFILKFHNIYNITAIARAESKVIEDKCNVYRYSDFNSFLLFLNKNNFDGVIHLATLYIKSHKSNDIKNIIDSNITFGTEICEALAISNFKGWFINVGTFWQFYKNISNNPLNLYAASKSAFESIINFYANTTNITFSNIYLNDTYGANDTRNKIFNLWLKAAKSNEILEMSKGEQLIDILYIDDVLYAFSILIKLLQSKNKALARNKVFALHTKHRKTLKELANIFEKVMQVKLNIIWGAKPYMDRENFIPFEGGDELPNWVEKTSFEEGLRLLKESLK
ncbi:NAD(P)-dependent oxidoreductase [Helicobacter sp. MIT 14-3879]|uniref:NAD-dependent epimerase/dehydratase family protein n=1 Tax=Helicobacter sp. MIT 14-3879 TaxID=2040649 RepID=UPI000E1E3724|nr:NAD(P)-dependent oxidoreductase [Helicobacter sp. MIT 14-3879]RDU61715.1 dTDP-glucose 4,6-dehydratase [Helicobacter sp. MIT 14-3879]